MSSTRICCSRGPSSILPLPCGKRRKWRSCGRVARRTAENQRWRRRSPPGSVKSGSSMRWWITGMAGSEAMNQLQNLREDADKAAFHQQVSELMSQVAQSHQMFTNGQMHLKADAPEKAVLPFRETLQ